VFTCWREQEYTVSDAICDQEISLWIDIHERNFSYNHGVIQSNGVLEDEQFFKGHQRWFHSVILRIRRAPSEQHNCQQQEDPPVAVSQQVMSPVQTGGSNLPKGSAAVALLLAAIAGTDHFCASFAAVIVRFLVEFLGNYPFK